MRTDDARARELTGIADHSREGSSHGPLEWTWCRAGLAPCTRTGWPSADKISAPGANRNARSPSKGQQERHRLAFSKDATSVLGA